MNTRKYHTVEECIVEASSDIVWNVITGFSEYSKWNTGIQEIRIEGNLIPGVRGVIRFPLLGRSLAKMPIEILKVDKLKNLEWQGYPRGLRSIVRGNHYHQLQKVSKNKTRLIHGEYFTGVAAPLAWSIVGKSYVEGFVKSTAAIKLEAERLSR